MLASKSIACFWSLFNHLNHSEQRRIKEARLRGQTVVSTSKAGASNRRKNKAPVARKKKTEKDAIGYKYGLATRAFTFNAPTQGSNAGDQTARNAVLK
jgi:hypothetical protein